MLCANRGIKLAWIDYMRGARENLTRASLDCLVGEVGSGDATVAQPNNGGSSDGGGRLVVGCGRGLAAR